MNSILAIYWNVDPEIFSIGPFSIRYYGLLFALGFLFGYYIFKRYFIIEQIPIKELDRLTIYAFLGVLIGARLGHVIFYEPKYYLQNPLEIIMIWHGGLASHGGVLGLFIALWFYAKHNFNDYLWILDRMSMPAALSGTLIRLGNLMNSEIYGKATELPWGFIFIRNNETLPKHPTQIYEALCYFLIFLFLFFLYNRKKKLVSRGQMTGWALILIFVTRFVIEFIKEVQVPFEQSMLLNMGQILSIPLIAIGFYILYTSNKRPLLEPQCVLQQLKNKNKKN